jgi:hypothetical protein
MADLETVIDEIIQKNPKDSGRLQPLANYLIRRFAHLGLPGLTGGSTAELRIPGLARHKDWDVAYDFAGKPRLLVSLKSIWRNASGVVPKRDGAADCTTPKRFAPGTRCIGCPRSPARPGAEAAPRAASWASATVTITLRPCLCVRNDHKGYPSRRARNTSVRVPRPDRMPSSDGS